MTAYSKAASVLHRWLSALHEALCGLLYCLGDVVEGENRPYLDAWFAFQAARVVYAAERGVFRLACWVFLVATRGN